MILDRIRNTDVKLLRTQLRIFSVLLYVGQIFAAITTLFNFLKFDVAGTMISVYAILFALIYLLYECRLKSMDEKIRRNFGFLYTYKGHAGLNFFMGLLNIGMDSTLGYVFGGLMCFNGCVLFALMCIRPEFKLHDDDDRGGIDIAQQQVTKYLANNPDKVAQIAAVSVSDIRSAEHP